jgi:hypothetical protein
MPDTSARSQLEGMQGVPSSEAFGNPTVRTARPGEWLDVGLRAAFVRLTVATEMERRDAIAVWPPLYETVTWSITIAERRGMEHEIRTAVEFVRDGVIHGTLDAVEPHGNPPVWHWRPTGFFEMPKNERHRGRSWRRKRAAYNRELAGRPVLDSLGFLVDQLLPGTLPAEH